MHFSLSSEAELKNFLYTAGPYVPLIVQSIYEDTDENFYYLLKNYANIASIMVNYYNKFIKILNLVVYEIAVDEISRSGSEYLRDKISNLSYYDFNCFVYLINCLIGSKNIKDIDFLDELTNNPGKLIYLKQCLVVETFPKQVYLYRWIERLSGCSCQGLIKDVKKRQSFIEVLHSGILKQRVKSTPQICNVCDRIFEVCQIRQSVYLNCQRIRILPLNKSSSNSQRSLPNNISDIYLNCDKVNSYQTGSIIDVCVYFSSQHKVKTMIQHQKIKMQENALIACVSSYPSFQNPHNQFFNSNNISIDYFSCAQNQYIKLYNNYKQIIQAVNEIKFNFLQPKTFTLLKLALLSSIYLWHPLYSQYVENRETLSLLILTDEQMLVNKISKIDHINYKEFPKVYDQQSINIFLLSCHNSVLIFNNPSKKQQQYIQKAISGQISEGKGKVKVNITVWVILNPLFKSKDFPLEIFDIIVDVTFLENPNNRQVNHDITEIVESLMENYLPKAEFSYTTVRAKRKYRELAETTLVRNKQSKRVQLDLNNSDFLEQYYIASRQHKKTNISNLMSLRKTAIGISIMRRCFSSNKTSNCIDFGDCIISIFLDQQTSRNKKGNSNTLLANQIAKFLLNQKQDMTINQFVFRQDDFQQVRKTVHRSSVFIRIVDQIRRIVSARLNDL